MNTLSDTSKLIMDVFWQNRVQKYHDLSLFDLFYEKSQWHKYHQDNFTRAVHELVSQGLIQWGEAYALILTEEGYNVLSHPSQIEKNCVVALGGYEMR